MDDVVWLSYADLAARLGIGHESARQKVKRARWARRKDNTGTVMIGVPVEVLQAHEARKGAPDRAPDDDPELNDDDPDHAPEQVAAVLVSHINRLERELEALREERDTAKMAEQTLALQLAGLRAALDAERALLAGERERSAEEQRRAEERLADERCRADERTAAERQRVEEWKAIADRFASQAEALTRAAESRRGWWPFRRSA